MSACNKSGACRMTMSTAPAARSFTTPLSPRAPCAKARQQFQPHRVIRHALAKCVEVLLRQHRRRHEHRDLPPVHHCLERRANRHLRACRNPRRRKSTGPPSAWAVPCPSFVSAMAAHLVRRFLIKKRALQTRAATDCPPRTHGPGCDSRAAWMASSSLATSGHRAFRLRLGLRHRAPPEDVEARTRLAPRPRICSRDAPRSRGRKVSARPAPGSCGAYSITRHSSPSIRGRRVGDPAFFPPGGDRQHSSSRRIAQCHAANAPRNRPPQTPRKSMSSADRAACACADLEPARPLHPLTPEKSPHPSPPPVSASSQRKSRASAPMCIAGIIRVRRRPCPDRNPSKSPQSAGARRRCCKTHAPRGP